MAKTITMQDIADKIGVSKVTVSKALSDKDGVSEELKKKIKSLADELGYRYNASAQAMKSGVSFNVGVIVPEKFTGDYRSFYLTVYQHLTKALEVYRYSSILHILSDEDELNLTLPRSYFDRKVDAYIVLGQVSKGYVELLNNSEVPIIFLDFYDDHAEVDSINTDNFYGAYGLTNYLIKNNHMAIAFVGSIHSTSSIQDRYLGYYKSLLEHKILVNQAYIIEDRDSKGKLIPIELPKEMPTA
ncbi:MAG: LacI family DNA-binding transcriptional regulator, partial [Vallitaleaceae bacterium]|nr:LacI family DNA-binding transcriptional regulator [Vallitaleaceae bacterium]